ncbi:beta-1,3-galactosyltransferase 4 [Eublepharis macularius]|uniref:Hexosyltransferase n=1 Tax=Eublepharis macularius TaxID=481883 RepID=A0AA97JBU1_EUBMA|nr:beta-1,3-galactosyltransferase 4 [Eublepharis macularius]
MARLAPPPRLLWRRPRLLLAGGLLAGLGALSAAAGFLASGGHEELLSRWLPPPAGARARAPAASLPPAGAFPLRPTPPDCGPGAPFLLVLVASAAGHAEQRQAVRRSWGAARWAGGGAVRTLFVLGLPADAALQAGLEEEARRHGDLVQGRFQDTYANLTLKTLALLGWAAGQCPAARFVVKADDDVFLNLPALARHLAALARPRGTYLGRVHWRVRPERDPSSRHHVPAALYPPDVFPPYCSGTTYVLSGDTVAALLAVAPSVPLVPVEDVFVGLCAQQAGIAPLHVARMAGAAHFPLDLCCYQEVLYSVHSVAPSEMLDVWQRARGQEEVCSPWQRTFGILRCRILAWLAAT